MLNITDAPARFVPGELTCPCDDCCMAMTPLDWEEIERSADRIKGFCMWALFVLSAFTFALLVAVPA